MSMSSESKFQVHLSSTKAMFQYMTLPLFKLFRPVEKGPSSGWRNLVKIVNGNYWDAQVELIERQNEPKKFPDK